MNYKKVLSALLLTISLGFSGVLPIYADEGQPIQPTPVGAQVVVSKSVDYEIKPGGVAPAYSSGSKTLYISLLVLRYDRWPFPAEYQAQTLESLTGPYFSVDFYVSTVVGGFEYTGGHQFASIGGTNPAVTWGPRKECPERVYAGNKTQSDIHWTSMFTETHIDSISAACS